MLHSSNHSLQHAVRPGITGCAVCQNGLYRASHHASMIFATTTDCCVRSPCNGQTSVYWWYSMALLWTEAVSYGVGFGMLEMPRIQSPKSDFPFQPKKILRIESHYPGLVDVMMACDGRESVIFIFIFKYAPDSGRPHYSDC